MCERLPGGLHPGEPRRGEPHRVNLSEAILNRADLRGAILNRVNLSEANLTEAKFGQTLLTDVDLSDVKGLESIQHEGPSTIGIDTLYRSQGKILPEAFLRGAGIPDTFITYIRHWSAGPSNSIPASSATPPKTNSSLTVCTPTSRRRA